MREQVHDDDSAIAPVGPYLGDAITSAGEASATHSPRRGRQPHNTLAERIGAASRQMHVLAFPPSEMSRSGPNILADGGEPTEEDVLLLLAAVRTLRELALPETAAVFVATGPSSWRVISERDVLGNMEFDFHEMPEVYRGSPLLVSRSRHLTLWRLLEQLLDTRAQVGYAVLLPLRIGDELSALFALGFVGAVSSDEAWLATAQGVATACGAGIQIGRLRQRILAEAQARDAFISLAAHELRNPITSIKGYAQLLTRQARKASEPLPEALLRSAQSIEQQSSRMAEMVGELLDASRIHRDSLELVVRPADLVGIVGGTVERRRLYHPTQMFTLESEVTSLVGVWDAGRVEQVVRDLLDNAARHSPDASTIVTTIEHHGNEATVTVQDEGYGVAEEDRERIFDYLYRSPQSVQRNLAGLGLGLYVSRHIIELHRGRLEFVAPENGHTRGSMFRVTLPIESPLTAR